MKRTRLAQHLVRILQFARYLNQHPEISFSENLLTEISRAELASRRDAAKLASENLNFKKRRGFLKSSASIVGLAFSTPLLNACSHFALRPHNKVIILGAGMAGLSAAYYLTKAGVPCALYESASRTGGRMYTQYNFNSEGMHCELGGELVDSNNSDLFALCKDFQIPVDVFAPEDKGLEANLYYIKGQYYTDKDLIPAFQKFAQYLDTAKKAPPASLDRQSLQEFLDSCHDVDPWVREVIRVAYVGESGLEAGEQSSLMMIQTIDIDFSHGAKFFGDSDETMHIHGGNAALTSAIEKYLRAQGVEIHLSTPLIAIKELAQKIELHFQRDKAQIQVQAEQVICTLPFSTLRFVEQIFSLNLNPLKKQSIRETAYGTNSKMIMGFHQRAWRQAQGHRPASNGMTYTDLFDQNFWDTSRLQRGQSGILTSYVGGIQGQELSAAQLHPYLKSAAQIFKGLDQQFDQNFSYFNWANYRHTKGSYACARPGDITRFGDISAKTELNGRLLFAGEHATKEFAGFMNGAALSGRKAAEQILKRTI
jgi:monoamine oxidase